MINIVEKLYNKITLESNNLDFNYYLYIAKRGKGCYLVKHDLETNEYYKFSFEVPKVKPHKQLLLNIKTYNELIRFKHEHLIKGYLIHE